MTKAQANTGKPARTILAALVALALAAGAWAAPSMAFAAEEPLAIRDVSVAPDVAAPGEPVRVSFRLTQPASVTLDVYSPHYVLLREMESNRVLPAGMNTLEWDGRDAWGAQVPDEAYVFTLTATTAEGGHVAYDPASLTGGKTLDVPIERIENTAAGKRIHYTVPQPARVDIRAGIHAGPLLANILSWEPRRAGAYTEAWDGMDTTGRIDVLSQPGSHVYIQAYTLPDNSIFIQGGRDDYAAYAREIEAKTEKSATTAVRSDEIRDAAVVRLSGDASMYYATAASLDPPISFKVYDENDREVGLAEKDPPTVSGDLRLVIVVDGESLQDFNEGRYEIVVFIDNERRDEEEHALSPYTYVLYTEGMQNGEHTVTINQAGLNGQVSSYSFTILVNNG